MPQNIDENLPTNYSARFLSRAFETTSNIEKHGRPIKLLGNDGKFKFIEQYLRQDKRKALMSVTHFIMHLNKETHKTIESPLITQAQLISEIGGQLGVWIGISIITLVEIMELLIDLCLGCLPKRRKKNVETNGEDTRHDGDPVWSNWKSVYSKPCFSLDSPSISPRLLQRFYWPVAIIIHNLSKANTLHLVVGRLEMSTAFLNQFAPEGALLPLCHNTVTCHRGHRAGILELNSTAASSTACLTTEDMLWHSRNNWNFFFFHEIFSTSQNSQLDCIQMHCWDYLMWGRYIKF